MAHKTLTPYQAALVRDLARAGYAAGSTFDPREVWNQSTPAGRASASAIYRMADSGVLISHAGRGRVRVASHAFELAKQAARTSHQAERRFSLRRGW